MILTGSATGLTSGMATLTIMDDDPAPTAVTLSLNPAAVGESAAATTVTVTASLNNSPLPDSDHGYREPYRVVRAPRPRTTRRSAISR